MPGKSWHGRRKRSFQSKKNKGNRGPMGTVAQQPADTQVDKPVTPPKVITPPAGAPVPASGSTSVRYPYVITELRTIGILAGALLVILVVLALVLS